MMSRLVIPMIITCLLAALPRLAYGQQCDCEGELNCPDTIQVNSTGQVCYEISDALNNDLANPDQGVCGVEITFTHDHIWDLELWLVSPGGDTVQLIKIDGGVQTVVDSYTYPSHAVVDDRSAVQASRFAVGRGLATADIVLTGASARLGQLARPTF